MNLRRMWAMFVARNYEFLRDRTAFGWNLAFPFLIILGFSFMFGDQQYQKYKIGIFPGSNTETILQNSTIPPAFKNQQRVTFIALSDRHTGEKLLHQHKLDLLVDGQSSAHSYWVNDSSPSGYLAEQLYLVSFLPQDRQIAEKGVVEGEEIRYIDWFFPGLLGMNMMFSSFWGVGYVVVRYRKNGTLKRLKATPLTPFEYLSAQMLSRLLLLIFTAAIVWFGSDLLLHFHVQGSLALIFFIFFLGGLSLCSIGLILAARGTSEEFTSGILNFISFPMMFLSEVWFSLEGSPAWVKAIGDIFPLKHMLDGIRMVMNEGAGLIEVQYQCYFLIAFTAIALSLAAFMFSWNE